MSETADVNSKYDKERVGFYDELPEWQKDNKYLIRGYRLNFTKWYRVLYSTFIFHNESVNIWSHLLGALSFICFAIGIEFQENDSSVPKWPLYLCFFCMFMCLVNSTIFHIGCCHSKKSYCCMQIIDYLGIVFFCFGTVICFSVYLFPC